MTEDIRLKIWEKDEKIMSEPFSIWDLWNHDDSNLADFQNIEFLQSYNKTDMNGVELFEEDIIKDTTDGTLLIIRSGIGEYNKIIMVMVVETMHDEWPIYKHMDSKTFSTKIVKVGTSFENPELLEE